MAGLFNPQIIGRIERLELKARRLVEGFMTGIHKSPYRGVSTDFAEHRHYVQGDDTRHLDWKIFARCDKFYVKKYESETNLEARFVLDTSRSMFFSSDPQFPSKFEYASLLVASLAYLVFNQHDAIGLNLFDRDVRTTFPPRASYSQYKLITDTLEKTEPGTDDTDLGNVLKKLSLQVKRRGMVVIISDFLDDVETFAEGLSLLAYRGNDVLLFRIEDPTEKDFSFTGQTVFLGMEGEGNVICDPRDLRLHYLDERERHVSELYGACRRNGFLMEEAATNAPLEDMLAGFLNFRTATGRR